MGSFFKIPVPSICTGGWYSMKAYFASIPLFFGLSQSLIVSLFNSMDSERQTHIIDESGCGTSIAITRTLPQRARTAEIPFFPNPLQNPQSLRQNTESLFNRWHDPIRIDCLSMSCKIMIGCLYVIHLGRQSLNTMIALLGRQLLRLSTTGS